MGDAHPVLGPGARLPDTIAVRMPDGTVRGLHELAFRAGHTALVVGGESVAGEVLKRIAGEVRAAADAGIVEDVVSVPACDLGGDRPTLLVVRPDGHVGLRADQEHAATAAAYTNRLTGPRG